MKLFLRALVFITISFQVSAQVDVSPKRIWGISLNVETWKIGHHQNTPQQSIIEHIKKCETIDNWSVLITETFAPGKYSKDQFDFLVKHMKDALKKESKDFVWNVIDQSEKEITFEWSHQGSGAYPPQHEIKRGMMNDKGFYFLSYTEKTSKIEALARGKWIKVIKAAELAEN